MHQEKQLDSALEAIIMKVYDLKSAIASMIFKLEHEYERLNWPNFLDNFAIISGHLTSLSKILSHDKAPNLRNLTVLPLHLSPEKDEELLRITEGRVSTFAHDLVPDYLRTKPDPLVEQKILAYQAKVSNLTYDASLKQVAQFNHVISKALECVNRNREKCESETSSRSALAPTSNPIDTVALVAAVGSGKGLKTDVPVPMTSPGVNPVGGNMMVGRPGGPQPQPGPGPMGPMGKVTSSIKTNIKAASQIHPYGR